MAEEGRKVRVREVICRKAMVCRMRRNALQCSSLTSCDATRESVLRLLARILEAAISWVKYLGFQGNLKLL